MECLIADIGMMKICQRTAMNKEFYDYRNSALRRMKRISDDRSAITDPGELERFNYARSEFSLFRHLLLLFAAGTAVFGGD